MANESLIQELESLKFWDLGTELEIAHDLYDTNAILKINKILKRQDVTSVGNNPSNLPTQRREAQNINANK